MKKQKNKNFAFRISERDLAEIKRKAKRAKLTTTDYLTKSALGKEIVIIDGLHELISELKGIGRNLNQLTVLANMGRVEIANLREASETLTQIYARLISLTEVV